MDAIAVATKALPKASINPAIAPSIFLPKFLPAASSPVAMSAINCPIFSAVCICNSAKAALTASSAVCVLAAHSAVLILVAFNALACCWKLALLRSAIVLNALLTSTVVATTAGPSSITSLNKGSTLAPSKAGGILSNSAKTSAIDCFTIGLTGASKLPPVFLAVSLSISFIAIFVAFTFSSLTFLFDSISSKSKECSLF